MNITKLAQNTLTKTIAAICGAALLASCATIVSGTHKSVSVSSTPPGATVTIDGAAAGKTPLKTELGTDRSHTVVLTLTGYKPYEVTLNRTFNGWVMGNLLIGGVVGIIVDFSTGAAYTLSPGEINAALMKSQRVSLVSTPDGLLVATVLHADPTWQKIGQLEKE